MKKLDLKMELLLLAVSLIPLILTLIFIGNMPAQVPIHWNFQGEIDGYGSPWLSPLLCLGLYLLFILIMFIDPKKENLQNHRNLIYKIRLALTLFFTAISCVIIYVSLGYAANMDRILLIGVPLLFSFLGNLIISIKPNWFIGVRTPWTLSNDNVWRKTHRLTGILWFWAGLCLSVLGFFIVPTTGFIILLIVISLICLLPIAYSYIVYKKELRVINKSGSSEEKK